MKFLTKENAPKKFSPKYYLETTKDTEVDGSRSYQSLVTPVFRGTKAPKTFSLLCLVAIREGRMIRDRSLLTS